MLRGNSTGGSGSPDITKVLLSLSLSTSAIRDFGEPPSELVERLRDRGDRDLGDPDRDFGDRDCGDRDCGFCDFDDRDT